MVLLAGCSVATQHQDAIPAGSSAASVQSQRTALPPQGFGRTLEAINGRETSGQPHVRSWLSPNAAAPLLYASDSQNNAVDVYDLKTQTLSGQISANHPTGLAVDQQNSLYVTNFFGGNTTVYRAGHTDPSLTLMDPGGSPDAVAVGNDGSVYVSDSNGQVYVYSAGATAPSKTLASDSITSAAAVTVDRQNDVYVCGYTEGSIGVVMEYRNASQPGKDLHLLGIVGPDGIALDNSGRTVLADAGLPGIDVFKRGALSPYRMFAKVQAPNRFAFDKNRQNVYVPMSDSDVNAYGYKSGNLISTIPGPSGAIFLGTAVAPAPRD
jgi:hypothetical protein